MTRQSYLEQIGYISNNEFRIAKERARILCIDIKDWEKPDHELLIEKNMDLMIELRLHLKHNCMKKFKDNFYRMYVLPRNKGVKAINYTGHTLEYNGTDFKGDYGFCIHKKRKPISIQGEDLYYIPGSYPRYSVTSCLQEDIDLVLSSNYEWETKECLPILIEPYL